MSTYHKSRRQEEIMLGETQEYEQLSPIADNFEDYLYELCTKLAAYDEKTLAKHGIKCSVINGKRNPWSYEYRSDGDLYQIQITPSTSSWIFSATQHGETESMKLIRELTDGAICGSLRTMSYNGKMTYISDTLEGREISFEGQESEDTHYSPYIDGIKTIPGQKFEFREKYGHYTITHLPYNESPKTKRKETEEPAIIEYEYVNPDGTTYVQPAPMTVTTYETFEDGYSDMLTKLDTFKGVWETRINALKNEPKKLTK